MVWPGGAPQNMTFSKCKSWAEKSWSSNFNDFFKVFVFYLARVIGDNCLVKRRILKAFCNFHKF